MVKEILKIRIDNGLGDNNPTFKGIELDDYSGKFSRMGFPELTATLMWPTPLDDEWTHKEYVVLRGEKFYVTDTPDAEKSNNTLLYKHDLGFTSEFARILGNTYFEDAVPSYSATYDKPCSNSSKFTFYGTIAELCDRLNCSFIKAGIADSILKTKTSLTTSDVPVGDGYCVMLDPYGNYDPTKSYEFSWEDKSHWEAITEGFNITEIPFVRRGKCIVFGSQPVTMNHVFEYGHDNELLSVKHKNAKAKVINRITMQGSSENIPHYYPNETEYGHISIQAKQGNKVLTTEMLEIANMTQLLSKLNADATAVLGKYTGVPVGNAKTEITKYLSAFDTGSFSVYTPDKYLKHQTTGTHEQYSEWHIQVHFRIIEEGLVVCRDVKGNLWVTNSAPPKEIVNLFDDITPEKLWAIKDGQEYDWSQLIEKQEDNIVIGYLDKGEYIFQFYVRILNRGTGNNEPVTSFCKLSSLSLESAPQQKTGYYWEVDEKKYDGVGSLGVKLSTRVTDAMIGDKFGWVASGRMPFQENLVPPKYRNTASAERFYNALNAPYSEDYALAHPDAYSDPDNIDPTTHKPKPYVFPNPFIEGAPSEYIYKNEDIKPTIEGVANASGQLMGVIADIAYDADDNDALKSDSTEDNDKNDSLKYEHSFFYIKLNIFNGQYGFDLFNHASQSDAMTIQMRDGSCNGCKFKIQAVKFTDESGLEYYKNPIVVNKEGKATGVIDKKNISESDLDPTQQNTQTHSIWICVQKDASTFGVIMPNKSNSYAPQVGDKFNIINIDLPQAYILNAEKRLEEEGMRFMLDNNEEKFSFDIQASRIFFAENPQVLSQLDEYSVIKVKYNGKIYEQYVSQLSIDCKSNEPLPNIGIDLTDTLAVGQSLVEQVAERASSLIANASTLGGNLGSGGGLSAALAERRYLNKQKSDRTPYKLSSDIGFEVGEFVSGGSGGIFYRDPETGQTYIEADKLKIRMKAIFEELEIAKVSTIGGKFAITPGGGINISFVEELTNSYRCYFKAKEDDKGAECRFVVGDQVQCHEFNIQAGTHQNASNRYYWRLVTAVNNEDSYIELSKTDCDNALGMESDAPQAGDTIVQLGNRNDTSRQSAIILSTVDAYAPCIILYTGINNYTLDNKAVVSYGYDKSMGQVFFRLGKSTDTHYLDYTQHGGLEVAGKISVKSTYGDKTLGGYIDSAAQTAASVAKAELQSKIDELQNQVDGVVEAWSYPYTPTPNNYPANQWTTDADKNAHVGDVFYNIQPAYNEDGTSNPDAGKAWRWSQNDSEHSGYHWHPIADSDAVRALQLAHMSVIAADVLYKQIDSQTDAPALPTVNTSGTITDLKGWSTDAPEWQDGKYIWQTTYVKKGDGTATFSNPTCISGRNGVDGTQGPQGVPGTPGANGTTYYTWIRYADDAQGNGISNNPSGKKYIGFAYNKTTATESNNKSDYTWSEIKGEQGVPGAKGEDGKTYYTWIQYSDNANGNPMYQQPNANTKYIGIAVNKESATEGNNPADYTWSLFKGADGTNITISSQSVKYSTNHGATQPADSTFTLNAVPTLTAGQYLWSMTTVTYSNGQSTKSYAVSRIGTDGQNGTNGTNGTSVTITSTSVRYAKSTAATQPADSAFTYTTIGAVGLGAGDYLWTKTEVSYSDGNSTKSYSVSRIGSDGDDGLPGAPGDDGRTPYVHYAYANSANGQTGFSTTYFKDALYVGVCTDYNQADPTTYSSYEWSRLRGEDGTPAKIVVVNADATAFVYSDNFATLVTPASIGLSATLQGTTGYQWSYKKEGATAFANVSGGTSATLSVSPTNTTYFPSGARACVFRCTSGGVYDEVTIVKVSSGSNGTNGINGANYAPNIFPSKYFNLSEDGARLTKAGSLQFQTSATSNAYRYNFIPAYHPITKAGKFSISMWAKVTSGTATINADINDTQVFGNTALSTEWVQIKGTANVTTLIGNYGFIDINVTSGTASNIRISDVVITPTDTPLDSWVPTSDEMIGEDAYTVLLTNESHIFEGDTEKAVAASTESSVIAYKGATQITATIGKITGMPAGMTVTISNNGTTSAKFTVNVTTALTTKQGTLYVPINVDGKTFTQVFSWSLSLKGKDGRGIVSIVEEYAIHSSGTSAPSDTSFSTVLKTMTDTNPYLWNREKTTYTDNTSETTQAILIGVKGQNGDPGATVVKVTNYYLAHENATGVTTSTAGWVTDPSNAVTDATKPYLWNYEVTEWSKGAATSTTPHVIGKFSKDFPENIMLKSETPINSASYLLKIYDTSEEIIKGQKYTCTIWGELGAGKTFQLYVNGGYNPLVILTKVADGVYRGSGHTTATIQDAFKKKLSLYHVPQSVSVNSRVDRIKVERGVSDDTTWTPALSEMGGPTLTEQYYLSTSQTTLTGGSWQNNAPTWVAGKFIWTRTKIDTPTGKTTYTDPICVTGGTGTSILAEYSVTGGTNASEWHPAYQNGDIWMRTSSDGGNTWAPAVRIQGASYAPNMMKGTKTSITFPLSDYSSNTIRTSAVNDEGFVEAMQECVATGGINAYQWVQTLFSDDPYKLFIPGRKYTISFEYKSTATVLAGLSIREPQNKNIVWVFQGLSFPASLNWTRVHVTKVMPANPYHQTNALLGAHLTSDADIGDTAFFRKFCVVEGESGEWAPASTEMEGKDGPWRKFQWAKNTSTTTAPTSGWQDAPMTASAGEYVWMRSGMVVPPATDPTWGTATRITGDKGAKGDPGSPVLMLDLSNEVMGILCNSSGTVTGSYSTSQASVWVGATKLTSGVTYSIAQTDGVSATVTSAGVVTPSALTKDNATIVVQATVDGSIILQSTITLYKVKAGANGAAAVSYSIEPSVDNITKSMTGKLSASSVTCSVYKTTGSSTRALTSEKTLSYQRIENGVVASTGTLTHSSGVSSAVAINDDTEAVIFELKDGSTILDRERVPVLSDASDLVIGGTNMLPNTRTWKGWYNENSQYIISAPITGNSADNLPVKGCAIAYKSTSDTTTSDLQLLSSVNLKPDTIYTLSVWARGYGSFQTHVYSNVCARIYSIDGVASTSTNSGTHAEHTLINDNKWHRYTVVFRTLNRDDLNRKHVVISRMAQGQIFLMAAMLEEGSVATDWSPNPHDIDYLQTALQDTTTIDGGLVLTSLISLGQNNEDYTTHTSWSGMSGIYDTGLTGNGIALWFGGDPDDLADYYNWNQTQGKWVVKPNTSVPWRVAKGVDRMDGSGYRAGGNLWWDADGNTTFVGEVNARGAFAGVRRKKIIKITAATFRKYITIKESSGVTYDELDAGNIGSIIVIQSLLSGVGPLYLPESDEYLGEQIVVSAKVNWAITGSLISKEMADANQGENSNSFGIAAGTTMVLTCKLVKGSDNRGYRRWVFERFNYLVTE